MHLYCKESIFLPYTKVQTSRITKHWTSKHTQNQQTNRLLSMVSLFTLREQSIGEAHRFLRTNTDNSNFQQQTPFQSSPGKGIQRKSNQLQDVTQNSTFQKQTTNYTQRKKPKLSDTPVISLTYNTHIPLVREEIHGWMSKKKTLF